jgi:hypothetical protein
MSHDDTDNETDTRFDPFDTDESGYDTAIMGQIGSGKTTMTGLKLATDIEELVDPKGEGDIDTECPLGDHQVGSETPQNGPEDDDNREGNRGGRQ